MMMTKKREPKMMMIELMKNDLWEQTLVVFLSVVEALIPFLVWLQIQPKQQQENEHLLESKTRKK